MAELPDARDVRVGAPGPTGFRGVGSLFPGLAQAAGQIGNVFEVYAAAEKEKEIARSEDGGYEVRHALETQLATGLREIDNTSKDSREYEERSKSFISDTMSTFREQLPDVVKDRKVFDKFQRDFLRVEHTTNSLTATRANERFLDEDKAATIRNRERNVTAAINAPDDEEAKIHIARNVEYLNSKRGRTLSHTEFAKLSQEDAYRVGVGRIFRVIDATGGDLEQYNELREADVFRMMKPEDQFRADQRFATRSTQAAAAVKRKEAEDLAVFQAYGDKVELFLLEHADTLPEGDIFAIARGEKVVQALGETPRVGVRGGPVVARAAVDAILQHRKSKLKAPKEEERKNDPGVERDMSTMALNATTLPQINTAIADLNRRYANGDGIYEDTYYRTLVGGLQDKKKALSADPASQLSRLAAQHGEAVSMMKADLGVNADIEMKGLADPRNAALSRWRDELARQSSYHGGPMAPMEWYRQNRVKIVGAMPGSLSEAIATEVGLLPKELRTLHKGKNPKQEIGQMIRLLPSLKASPADRARYVRGLVKMREFYEEFSRQGRTFEEDTGRVPGSPGARTR